MSVATPTAPRSINPALLLLVAVLLAALFAGALLLGRSGGSSAPSVTGPVLQRGTPAGSQSVSPPPRSAALPRLRHPAPKPTPVKAAPTTVAPITPAAPTTPAPSTGGSGGGGGGGTVIIG